LSGQLDLPRIAKTITVSQLQASEIYFSRSALPEKLISLTFNPAGEVTNMFSSSTSLEMADQGEA